MSSSYLAGRAGWLRRTLLLLLLTVLLGRWWVWSLARPGSSPCLRFASSTSCLLTSRLMGLGSPGLGGDVDLGSWLANALGAATLEIHKDMVQVECMNIGN